MPPNNGLLDSDWSREGPLSALGFWRRLFKTLPWYVRSGLFKWGVIFPAKCSFQHYSSTICLSWLVLFWVYRLNSVGLLQFRKWKLIDIKWLHNRVNSRCWFNGHLTAAWSRYENAGRRSLKPFLCCFKTQLSGHNLILNKCFDLNLALKSDTGVCWLIWKQATFCMVPILKSYLITIGDTISWFSSNFK